MLLFFSFCLFLCLKKKGVTCKICSGFEGSRVTDNCCCRGDLEASVRCSPQPGLTGTGSQPLRLTDASLKTGRLVVVFCFFILHKTEILHCRISPGLKKTPRLWYKVASGDRTGRG